MTSPQTTTIASSIEVQSHKIEFDYVIKHMNSFFEKKTELKFKKKYQPIFNTSNYYIYGRTYADHCRLYSVQEEYYGVNSILLPCYKIMLYTTIDDFYRRDVCFVDRAHIRDNSFEICLYRFQAKYGE
mgnify:FL=1|tara:strand:+ start:250 stop:633 length:384 start_codon:yes stop_codon:yes gene_type:complete